MSARIELTTHPVVALVGSPTYRLSCGEINNLVEWLILRGTTHVRHRNGRGFDRLVKGWLLDITDDLVVESWDALWQRDGADAMANATREMLLGDWTTRGRDAAPTRASVLVYYPGDLAAIEAARELGIPARSHLQLWEGRS